MGQTDPWEDKMEPDVGIGPSGWGETFNFSRPPFSLLSGGDSPSSLAGCEDQEGRSRYMVVAVQKLLTGWWLLLIVTVDFSLLISR